MSEESRKIIEKGPVIGYLQEKPIHDFLKFDDGLVLIFSHAACADRDGRFALSQLSDDEYLVSPGLVYRQNA